MLWTLHQLQEALKLPVEGGDVGISGISIDTRTLQKGDLFIALKAERDGHDFVEMAEKKGASACVVSRKMDVNIPQLVVKSTLRALIDMASHRVRHHIGKRVAVTGSSGKTSLSNMLATVTHAHRPEKSYNNHWGVPLTLARMPVDEAVAVIEIGTNHPGEIAPLAKLTHPHAAVITNIAHAHIGNFPSEESLADEKLSITQGLEKDGILVLLEETFSRYKNKISGDVVTFGLSHKADVYLIEKIRDDDSMLRIATPNGNAILHLYLKGDHHILNALATVAALYALKLPTDLLKNMHNVAHLEGRGKTHDTPKGVTVIDDSFNANPLSMKMAISNLKNHDTKGRKIAILGDMLELGEESPKYHAGLAPLLDGVDGVITVGENMRFLDEQLPEHTRLGHYRSVQGMDINAVANQLKSGDTVLVKGSKGIFWIANFMAKLTAALT